MTDERIAALEAMCQAATEGPWRANQKPGATDTVISKGTNGNTDTDAWYGGQLICESARKPDVEFIASARQLVPDLLAEVRRLQADKAKLWAFVDEVAEMAERDSTADVLIQELHKEVSR